MHTVELLDRAIERARQLGYEIRHEWLGGKGGGDCELAGRKILFVDLACPPEEQLAQVLEALRRHAARPAA